MAATKAPTHAVELKLSGFPPISSKRDAVQLLTKLTRHWRTRRSMSVSLSTKTWRWTSFRTLGFLCQRAYKVYWMLISLNSRLRDRNWGKNASQARLTRQAQVATLTRLRVIRSTMRTSGQRTNAKKTTMMTPTTMITLKTSCYRRTAHQWSVEVAPPHLPRGCLGQ
jgi:hypothetical protein